MKNAVIFVLLAGLLLQSCAALAPSPTPTAVPTETPSPTAAPTQVPATEAPSTPGIVPPPAGGPGPASETMVQKSIAFLHDKFTIAADAVTVGEVTPMTWPDASLGCPKKGVLYIQAVTPGFQIMLEANQHVFTFHTNETDLVVLCSVEPPDEIYQVP